MENTNEKNVTKIETRRRRTQKSGIGEFITNPCRGRLVKNVGFMAAGAAILMAIATAISGKSDEDEDEDE